MRKRGSRLFICTRFCWIFRKKMLYSGKKRRDMKNILYILACLAVTLALGSSYCERAYGWCKCQCHDGLETCQEYCWRCAHKHHGDCECKCHDDNCPMYGNVRTPAERNHCFRRNFCSDCENFHWGREESTDYGMKKGWLPKKRPYLHPIRHFPSLLYAFDDGYCE